MIEKNRFVERKDIDRWHYFLKKVDKIIKQNNFKANFQVDNNNEELFNNINKQLKYEVKFFPNEPRLKSITDKEEDLLFLDDVILWYSEYQDQLYLVCSFESNLGAIAEFKINYELEKTN